MFIVYTLLLLLIIFGSLAIGYIVLYNKLQHYTTKVDQAESIIDETLRNRYDLIIEASTIINNTVSDKKNLLKDVAKLKDTDISNFDLDRKLTDSIALIRQLKSDYEVLANNKDFKKILSELKSTDEKMHAAKSYYNKYTNLLNDQVRKFPSNVIAKMHDIEVKLFFDKKDMHDDKIDDFKF